MAEVAAVPPPRPLGNSLLLTLPFLLWSAPMHWLKPTLGYAGAALSLAALLGIPALMPLLCQAIAATGLEVDPSFTGGPVERSVSRGGFAIDVHRLVRPKTPLQDAKPFTQLAFKPADRLPPAVDEEVDLDGDGRTNVRVRFAPQGAGPLEVEVTPLGPLALPMHKVSRESFHSLIARVGDAVVVRVPLSR